MTGLHDSKKLSLSAAGEQRLDGSQAGEAPGSRQRADAPLAHLRSQIDALDRQMLALLGARRRLVMRVQRVKRALELDPVSPEREAALLDDLAEQARCYGLDPAFVRALFSAVIRSSCPAEAS